ncbi:hypothetical protein ACHAXR_010214 [Thalassiosira sp. AJA248-18]
MIEASPTIAQQRGLAYASKPFEILSLIASIYVLWYQLFHDRQRLQRIYHRFILAMNVGLLVYSFNYIWNSFAVPEGTPNYVGASGTIRTCTANGFLAIMFGINIPIYYAALSLQAYMGIRNNFKEEKYRWIEKWVHLVACLFPCAISAVFAVTENLNPSGAGCYVSKAPRGCESDPDVPCTRGDDIKRFELIVGLSLIFLYFIFPPSIMLAMYCWIKKVEQKIEDSLGMQRIRVLARKELLTSVSRQMSLYLFSFWFTWVFNLAHAAYQTLTGGKILYNLLIFAHCIHSSQGWVFAIVYFTLERMGTPKVECIISPSAQRSPASNGGIRHQLTVEEIRSSAQGRSEVGNIQDSIVSSSRRRSSFVFNIFDGTADPDSPWAKYVDGDYDSVEENGNEGAPEGDVETTPLPNNSESAEQA